MNEETLRKNLEEYKENSSRKNLLHFLKKVLIEELEEIELEKDKHKHDLNLLLRDLEEELDWIESEKLSEYEPERQ